MSLQKVGILGGMGPEATILLQSRLIKAIDAQGDADHIPLLIHMNPQVPSRISWLIEGKGTDPAPELVSMAKCLERAGASVLAMPCNTAHTFAPAIQDAVEIPFLHMPELAAKHVSALVAPRSDIGILASPVTEKINLFSSILSKQGLNAVYPGNSDQMLNAIRDIKANGAGSQALSVLQRTTNVLQSSGVKALLIGCSEFSLLANDLQTQVPTVDTLDVLVDVIVQLSGARRRVAA